VPGPPPRNFAVRLVVQDRPVNCKLNPKIRAGILADVLSVAEGPGLTLIRAAWESPPDSAFSGRALGIRDSAR
jgi:hypothetical protein